MKERRTGIVIQDAIRGRATTQSVEAMRSNAERGNEYQRNCELARAYLANLAAAPTGCGQAENA